MTQLHAANIKKNEKKILLESSLTVLNKQIGKTTQFIEHIQFLRVLVKTTTYNNMTSFSG